MIPHRWYALLIVDGREVRFSGVDALPACDRTKQYDHPALDQLVQYKADNELGAGKWRYADTSNPYKFNASPASDYGLSR